MKSLPAPLVLALLLFVLSFEARGETWQAPTRCELPLAQRLYESAMAAPAATQSDGRLYGVRRWRDTTRRTVYGLKFPGLLSCAYTVSAIFKGACAPIGELAAVSAVEARLARWRRISSPRELKRGDVVFWRPVPGKVMGVKCPGHWHVGISLGGDLTMDNDWWSGDPKVGRIVRACTVFDHARRPPG